MTTTTKKNPDHFLHDMFLACGLDDGDALRAQVATEGAVREAIEIAFEEYKHDIGSMLDHDEITGETADLMETKILEALDVLTEELDL